MPKKEKPVLLLCPHVMKKNILYRLIIQDGYFYFCKVGNRFYASEEQENLYCPGMTEDELLKDRNNFKLPLDSVSEIRWETKRNPWTEAFDNYGTVVFFSNSRKIRFILCSQTPPETFQNSLISNDFSRLVISESDETPPAVSGTVSKTQAKVLNLITYLFVALTVLIAVWSFLLPDLFFPYGALFGIILPFAALVVLIKNKTLFSSLSKSKTLKKRNDGSLLFLPILLIPLFLCVWIFRDFNLMFSLFPIIFLVCFTIVCIVFALVRVPSLRNKAGVFCLVLFILSFNFSALVITNCSVYHTVASFSAKVENKSYRIGYSGRVFTRSYYIDFSAWGGCCDRNELPVPYSIYRSAAVGDTLKIYQERGLWGIDWYNLSL